MCEPAPACCSAPTSHLLGLLCGLWAGRAAGLAVPRMPAGGAVLLLINTQATLGESLIGIRGMQRLRVQAAGLFLVLLTNTVPLPR